MSKSRKKKQRREKAAAQDAAARADEPRPVIPDAPPMSGRTKRWPLVVAFSVYFTWLILLAYLALHSTRYTAGG